MRLAALLLFVFASAAIAQDGGRPRGTNCDLAAPPASAGEEMNHGTTMRIYPRARDIGAGYNGCQAVWLPKDSDWLLMSLSQVVDGDPVRLWSPVGTPPQMAQCRYRKGKVIQGDPDHCPAPQFLLVRSMPAGCVARMRGAAAEARKDLFFGACRYE